ncbi:MAG: molybdopterin-synthase adenylyltransferase MoeB [Hyphomicrobiales bacterium]|jgi:molybdopterin/thiamine biosynthesis adenylyltransferase
MSSALSPQEIERYARHLVIRDVGGPGQQKLRAAHVAVVGVGGLGAPCLLYLAAAGIGALTLIDDDTVSLSNLQRQVIHPTSRVGDPKVRSAADALHDVNPHVAVHTHQARLSSGNAHDLLQCADVVVDGSDSFETRAHVATACQELNVPLVTGAVSVWDGSLTVIAPHLSKPGGDHYPRFTDLFPSPPAPGSLPTCAEVGVIGALTGMLGTMQAMEVIKLITGAGEPLFGRLLLVNALTMRFDEIAYG